MHRVIDLTDGMTMFQGSFDECEDYINKQDTPHLYENKPLTR